MKKTFLFTLLFASLFISCQREEKLIHQVAYRARVDEMFNQTMELASGRSADLFSVLDSGLNGQERDAMRFLLAFAPLSDLADYDGAYFLKEVRASLLAREEMPWGKRVPEEIFLNFVLPLRVNNENLDTFRSAMYGVLKERVSGLGMREAALEVNHWCHEKVTYRGSDERTSSPLASMKTSWGRCGEESTFTVAAMRAVGIPARQVYTPRWAHTDDNHAWVEVWVDGQWQFLGACEPSPRLNMGWFEEAAARTMLVHTRTYGCYFGKEEVIDRQDRYSELNLIARYAPSRRFVVKVTDSLGRPVPRARVEYRLYNYAEFFPIARKFTGADGKAAITCGLGDLLVWATDGERTAFEKISVAGTELLHLSLSGKLPLDSIYHYDLVPPVKPAGLQSDTSGEAANQIRLKQENKIREKYMRSFMDSTRAVAFATRNGFSPDTLSRLLPGSQGNWREITCFLMKSGGSDKHGPVKFLSTLTEKDIRDISCEILMDHYSHLPVNQYGASQCEGKPLYWHYVASARVSHEMIRPWREELRQFYRSLFPSAPAKTEKIIHWIRKNIAIDEVSNRHSRAPLSPTGVLALRLSDPRSRDIFFVASLRSLGIAVRINPVTSIPEYWKSGTWISVEWEKPLEQTSGEGFLHLVNTNPGIDPVYFKHFSISQLRKGSFHLLEFPEGKRLSTFPDRISFEPGTYMLTSGNRMADGGVLSSVVFFRIEKNQLLDLMMQVREPALDFEVLGKVDLGGYTFTNLVSGSEYSGSALQNPGGNILIWISPLQEPSRHVLIDIPPFAGQFEAWPGNLIFLLKEQDRQQLAGAPTQALPAKSMFLTENGNRLLGSLQELHGKNIENTLPLVFFLDGQGNVALVSSGYSIGTGEMLTRLLGQNRKNL